LSEPSLFLKPKFSQYSQHRLLERVADEHKARDFLMPKSTARTPIAKLAKGRASFMMHAI